MSLLKRLLLGGVVTLLLPCAAVFIWAGLTDQVANPAGASSSSATWFDALVWAYTYGLFIGLPAFIVWSVVCIALAWLPKRTPSK